MRRLLVVLSLVASTAFQQAQPPTFRTGTNLVQVDAIVDDRDGQPVSDLTLEDFELLDDGRPMTLRSVRLLGSSRTETGETFAPIRTVDDEQREASRDDVRVFAILLDDYHVARMHEQRVLAPLRTFIESLPPSDLVGVYGLFDSINDAHLTRDRGPALQTLAGFYGRKGDYTPKYPVEEEHLKLPMQIEQIRLDIARNALSGLATHLGGLKEGRKTLVFVSEGFALDMSDLLDITTAANRMNVAIYPVDPRGLTVGGSRMGMGPAFLISPEEVLRQFALDTGGDAIVQTNDFKGALARIVRDSSAYYLLAYESPHPDDGKFHKITVHVKRPRLTVKARSGYLAFKNPERTTTTTAAEPVPEQVTAALASLTASLRPDADEPAERRHLIPDAESEHPKELVQMPTLAVAQGRFVGPPAPRREFPRTGTLVARAKIDGQPEMTSRLMARDGRVLTELPVTTADGLAEVRFALPTLGQGDYVLELTARANGRTSQQYIAFRVLR
ncbi:MAG TPA: VWA domain-containing protein [Vicinamibacterales bacterium]